MLFWDILAEAEPLATVQLCEPGPKPIHFASCVTRSIRRQQISRWQNVEDFDEITGLDELLDLRVDLGAAAEGVEVLLGVQYYFLVLV